MIFSADDLVELFEDFSTERGEKAHLGRATASAAVSEADQLSSDRTDDAPAAIFFALARRSRAISPWADEFIRAVTHAVAIATGLGLDAADVELTIFRARVLRSEVTWPELRAWFSTRLRPIAP